MSIPSNNVHDQSSLSQFARQSAETSRRIVGAASGECPATTAPFRPTLIIEVPQNARRAAKRTTKSRSRNKARQWPGFKSAVATKRMLVSARIADFRYIGQTFCADRRRRRNPRSRCRWTLTDQVRWESQCHAGGAPTASWSARILRLTTSKIADHRALCPCAHRAQIDALRTEYPTVPPLTPSAGAS